MSPKTAVCSALALLVIAPAVLATVSIWLALQASYRTPTTFPLLLLSFFTTLVIAMCVVGFIRQSSGHWMHTRRSWGLGISAFFAALVSGEITLVLVMTWLGFPPAAETLGASVFRLLFGVIGWIFVIKSIVDAAKDARKTPDGEPDEELGATMASDHEG